MEVLLRAALIAWLAGSSELAGLLNAVTEEVPFTDAVPWLSIATSAATNWSTKTEPGAEVRITLQLQARGDQPGSIAPLVAAIDAAVRGMPAVQTGLTIASIFFLRSRSEQKTPATRSMLMEYRFRVQAA